MANLYSTEWLSVPFQINEKKQEVGCCMVYKKDLIYENFFLQME